MFEQHSFNFCRSDGKTLVLDHLFTAVDNVIEAISVTGDDIARPIPAIAKYSGSCVWRLPVAQHELRAAHNQFARFAWSYRVACQIKYPALGLRDGHPYGFRFVALRIEITDMSHGRSLGHSVSLGDRHSSERSEAASQFGRQRRGPGFQPLQAMGLGEQSGFCRLH